MLVPTCPSLVTRDWGDRLAIVSRQSAGACKLISGDCTQSAHELPCRDVGEGLIPPDGGIWYHTVHAYNTAFTLGRSRRQTLGLRTDLGPHRSLCRKGFAHQKGR